MADQPTNAGDAAPDREARRKYLLALTGCLTSEEQAELITILISERDEALAALSASSRAAQPPADAEVVEAGALRVAERVLRYDAEGHRTSPEERVLARTVQARGPQVARVKVLEEALKQIEKVEREDVPADLSGFGYSQALLRCKQIARAALAPAATPAAEPAEPSADTARLDWLERQLVKVRSARRYGSAYLFSAEPGVIDGGEPSDLRSKIDEQRGKGGR